MTLLRNFGTIKEPHDDKKHKEEIKAIKIPRNGKKECEKIKKELINLGYDVCHFDVNTINIINNINYGGDIQTNNTIVLFYIKKEEYYDMIKSLQAIYIKREKLLERSHIGTIELYKDKNKTPKQIKQKQKLNINSVPSKGGSVNRINNQQLFYLHYISNNNKDICEGTYNYNK